MGEFDTDGRTPTEERGHRFDAKAGQYPLLRWQSRELRLDFLGPQHEDSRVAPAPAER